MPSNLPCFFHLLHPQAGEDFILRLFLHFLSVRIFHVSEYLHSFLLTFTVMFKTPFSLLKVPFTFFAP